MATIIIQVLLDMLLWIIVLALFIDRITTAESTDKYSKRTQNDMETKGMTPEQITATLNSIEQRLNVIDEQLRLTQRMAVEAIYDAEHEELFFRSTFDPENIMDLPQIPRDPSTLDEVLQMPPHTHKNDINN